jgi:hypothetical protein
MSDQENEQSAMESMGQMYAISLLPFIGVTIGGLMEGWKFQKAATAGLWAGPGFIFVFVIAYYAWKAIRLVWSDIYSALPRTVQHVLEVAAVLLLVVFLAFALIAGSDADYPAG